MRERSLAGKALTLLPFAAVAAWSGNAALMRMHHERRGAGPEQLEFVVGSMDDTIMETLETGDVVLFSRKLTALQPLAALYTWVARQRYDPRFDHCGWVYVDKLGRKFVVEETLAKVQCRPFSARILTSESSEIAVLPLKVEVRAVSAREGGCGFSLADTRSPLHGSARRSSRTRRSASCRRT